MKKTANAIFTLLFLIMLLLPLTFTNTKEGAVSDADGRVLTAKPEAGLSNWHAGAEGWLNDRLGFRDEIAISYAAINDKVFDELINPSYQYGRDRYTFLKLHDNVQYGDYHEAFAGMVIDMQEYCESRGTKFYYVFDPEKESLYRELLPAGVNYNDGWVDKMLDSMEEKGVNVIDLRDALAAADAKDNVFNRIYDAGHWNQNGAFYGMRELTKYMHNDNPEVSLLEKSEYDITQGKVDTLYGSNYKIEDAVAEYNLKTGYEDITGSLASEVVINSTFPFIQLIKNDSEAASGTDRMLIFQDAMYGQFAFSRAKETASVFSLHNALNFDYYYNIFKPEVVVFETMEYLVNEESYPKAAMEAKDPNPGILENYPEDSFNERREALLGSVADFETDAAAVMIPGKDIDRVFLSDSLSDASYVWLITGDRILDFIRNDQNTLMLSVMHGELNDGADVVLCRQTADGEIRKAVIPVTTKLSNLSALSDFSSRNTSEDLNRGTAVMTSSVENNVFNCTTVAVYDEELTQWVGGAATGYAAGTVSGDYTHNQPDGDYKLLLVAGGNLMNEWIVYDVHLEAGKTYWIQYNVDGFSAEMVSVSGFSLSEPAR